MSKILVTGATGSFGKQAVQFLSKRTDVSNIAVLVRDESKTLELKNAGVEIRPGNYDDISSLKSAFTGIDKLLFVSANDINKRMPQHKNVLEAAKESGIKHIVYTSFIRKNETESSPIAAVSKVHLYTEDVLLKSDIAYTILQNSLYMEFIPFYIGDNILENQMIYFPSGNGKVAFLLRTEMAEIAANILTSEGHENKIYVLASEKSYSYSDIANMISKITRKDIKFVSPPVDEYMSSLKKAGVPESLIQMKAGFAQAIQQGEFDNANPEISKLLGRKPVTPEEFLRGIYS